MEKASESDDDVLRNASLNHSYFNNGPGIVEHNTERNPIILYGNAPPSKNHIKARQWEYIVSRLLSPMCDVNALPSYSSTAADS